MSLPNIHFQNFPIEFKKISPEDFPHFQVENKINLQLQDGYIGDSFIKNISLEKTNTVVLNCGVGSGKTTAIIKAVKQFYLNEEYVVFIASPFVSLVEQYFNDVQEKAEIPQSQIYRNEWIGESTHRNINYTDKRVHIVTINTLLGNPGEDRAINSFSKRKYLDDMAKYCEENGKKVVFIYDEIHDSIFNFKEKFVFNLWKWRNVIHKNFVISATYSEASKIVIEYLAELTNNQIKILEAERVRIPSKLSDLFLYYDNAIRYNNDNGNLVSIVENVFERGLDVDILCYSKKLCKSILSDKEQGVGRLLFDKYGEEINDCTSGLENKERVNRNVNENRYNKNKCNIGTNFKSGVSIEKENHALILIFPPKSASGDFKNSFGIFSGGINSIIQALARKRKKGEIHILIPRPTKFDFNSFPFSLGQKQVFKDYFEPIQYQSSSPSANNIVDRKTIDYISLENQDTILRDFYNNELRANIESSIMHIENNKAERINKVRLDFPEFKLFKLEEGENYLANKYKFLGKDLSGYISYCAATNQFVNCNLAYTNWKPTQNFKEGFLQYCFNSFFDNYFDIDWFNSLRVNVTDSYTYHEIRNTIFDDFHVKLYKSQREYIYIKPFENKVFENQLIAFIQRKLFRNNLDFIRRYEQSNGYVIDSKYTRGDYFRSCIAHAHRLNRSTSLPIETKAKVDAYLKLEYFKNKILNSIQSRVIRGLEVSFVSKTPSDSFISSAELDSFKQMCSFLCENDLFIQKNLFDFKRIFVSNKNDEAKINRFYTYLKKDFFILKTKKIDGIDRDEILSILPIPEHTKVLDFISPASVLMPEENMAELKIVNGKVVIK